jgi:hypothetical protein
MPRTSKRPDLAECCQSAFGCNSDESCRSLKEARGFAYLWKTNVRRKRMSRCHGAIGDQIWDRMTQ